MISYDFSYKVNGDTYSSDKHERLSLAKEEVERLRKIYKDDVFVGRW